MKNNLIQSFLTVLFTVFSFGMYAQSVNGTVTSADGPLPGATVQVKGTNVGVTTDFDGNFTIEAGADDVLVVSFVGFATQEVAVDGQDSVTVTLEADNELDEIVVTGYGTQKEKEITSAVVSVGVEDFNKGPINDPTQLLQGKVAGLSIYNKGGNPNDDAVIRLRGLSTVGANVQPLVVIDGIIGGSLNNVDPNDIAEINVLKDGSASAIYGSRGSSGVILVTTKKGASGDLKVTYNGQFSTSSIANAVDVMSASEFRALGRPDVSAGAVSTDWIEEVTRAANTSIHNVSLSGGQGNTQYRVSANLRDVEGILDYSGFDQFNTRLNFSTRTLNDKLKINFTASYTDRDINYSFNEALRYAVIYNPTAPVMAADSDRTNYPVPLQQYGGYFEAFGVFDLFNPRAILDLNSNTGRRIQFNYGANLNYKFTDNINVNLNIAEQSTKLTNKEYYGVNSLFRGGGESPTRRGLAKLYTQENDFRLAEVYGAYKNRFGTTDVNFALGYSYQQTNFFDYFLELGDFPDNSIDYINAIEVSQDLQAAGQIQANSNASPDDKIIAFFSRLSLTFDDAIFFNASLRQEGSTRLGENNKWGLFPSVGLGADLNKYLELSNVDLLKVRVGYGVTGALPGQNGLTQEVRTITNGAGGSVASTLQYAANPDLKWEEKAETNLGIEFKSGRLGAVLDIYSRDISDFIINREVDASVFGFDRRFENAGKINTKGVELALNYDVVSSDKLTYNTGVVFSTYKSILEEYVGEERGLADNSNLGAPGQNDTEVILVAVGEEIGQIWGPVYAGTTANGSQEFVDLNGGGVSIDGDPLGDDTDMQVLGKGIPDFELGWTNQLSFGRWNVNAFFRGAFGHSLVNTNRNFYEPRVGSQGFYNLVNTEYADDAITNARFSSLYVEKADFFRLDNLTIGYDVDTSNLKGFDAIGLSLNMQNVFTITDYTGVDPDPSLSDRGAVDNGGVLGQFSDPLVPGIDRRYNYFNQRSFTLGLNVKF